MEEIKKELNSATEYLRAMKKRGQDKGDCDNILMHLANIEDILNELFISPKNEINNLKCAMKETKMGKKCETQCKECKEIYVYCSI